ncbi:MAG: prepilin-type N-terminal cleavage/methylation domain-containing protein [Bdellovibrionales bacterium]|nr:prepilin-type N-terminal cleavage/methylation domain-containing protein [Bdellovibrionales bacterium]
MSQKQNQGFSLVELMIVVGILSVVLYGSMSVFSKQMNDLKVYESKLSKINLEKDLGRIINEPTACNTAITFPISFSDPSNSVFNNFEISDKYGNLFISPNTASVKNTYDQLQLDSIVLTNPNNIPANGSGVANLLVFAKAKNTNLSMSPIEVPIEVMIDASGEVSSCVGGGGGNWASMPSGAHCGIFMQTQGSIKAQADCDGHNPASSCPTGFTRADLGYFEAGGGARKFATCVKN